MGVFYPARRLYLWQIWVTVVEEGLQCVTLSVHLVLLNSVSTKLLISDTHSCLCFPQTEADACIHTHTHAAIKYRFMVLSFRPGAIIPHITALHTQGPHCSDYREETYNPIHPTLLCCVCLSVECGPRGSVCTYTYKRFTSIVCVCTPCKLKIVVRSFWW